MEQYNELASGRNPRGCKKGKPAQAEAGKPSKRGRKPKTQTFEEILQSSSPYATQSQMPNMSPTYSMQHFPRPGNAQQHYQQANFAPAYSNHDPRIMRAATVRQQTSRYYTRAQVNKHATAYLPNDQMNASSSANQRLYPNLSASRTTSATTYTVPQQLSELSSMTTNTSCRYYTRSVAHNLPLPTAPTRHNNMSQMNPISQQPLQQTHATGPQQIRSPLLAARLPPKNKKHITCQTEFSLTDDEVKLIILLKSKNMDSDNLEIKIREDGELDVTYYQTNTRSKKIMDCVEQVSNAFKQSLFNAITVRNAFQATLNNTILNLHHNTNGMNQAVVPYGSLQTVQDPRFETVSPDEESPDVNNGNIMNAANVLPPQPEIHNQMPQQRNMSPEMQQGFPIPTIYNQNVNNFEYHPQAAGMPQSIRGHNFNMPLNLPLAFDPSFFNLSPNFFQFN